MSPIKVAIFPSCFLVGSRAIWSKRGNARGKKFLPSLPGSSALKAHTSSNQGWLIICSPLFGPRMYGDSISLFRFSTKLEKIFWLRSFALWISMPNLKLGPLCTLPYGKVCSMTSCGSLNKISCIEQFPGLPKRMQHARYCSPTVFHFVNNLSFLLSSFRS